jgi:hypothetical protein
MVRLSEASVIRNREKQRGRNATGNMRRNRSDYSRRDNLNRPFVGWDGEGYSIYTINSKGECSHDHRYMLFGSSTGHYISGPSLGTEECLNLILYVERMDREVFHIGFAFEYDVNMILKDLEWRYLAILYDTGAVKWHGYLIKHVPHKIFSVSKNGTNATIYDVFGFFHVAYLAALSKHNIGTADTIGIIKKGKANRSVFSYSELEMVIRYWSAEISLFPPLMDKVRESCYETGFYITQWHGPGALAAFALKKFGVARWKARKVPIGVQIARTFAYAGGRFQDWLAGYYMGPVYTADLNSAYAYACAQLPRLDTGKWAHHHNPDIKTSRDIAHFALYHIRFDASEMEKIAREKGIPFPLYHRDKKGYLTWPAKTKGWYWSPEAATVAGSKYAEFLEEWRYEDDGTRPFEFLHDTFERRLDLQSRGNPIEKAYKWFLAAIYGYFARQVGWDKNRRQAPGSHQIEWAGFITSYCRALVYRVAVHVAKKGGLISIDTDGVTSTIPFDERYLPNGTGRGLGQWKLENYSGILHWQNGIYWLRKIDGSGWSEPKTRGIPRRYVAFDRAYNSLWNAEHSGFRQNPSINLVRNRFIGYRQALQHQYDSWRHWLSESVEIVFGGSGKGRHVPALCRQCIKIRLGESPDGLHQVIHMQPNDIDSQAHKLPWLQPQDKPEENLFDHGIWEDIWE